MQPQFDGQDSKILNERIMLREYRAGPRVGDFVHMLDGTLRRFAHDWGDGLQTTYLWNSGRLEIGSFHLGEKGGASYSGSLDKAIPLKQLADTGETKNGAFWFFHHNEWKAHNGVNVEAPCRVFQQVTS